MVVSKRWYESGPESNSRTPCLTSTLPLLYLNFISVFLTSFLPQFNPAQPAIPNHGLETTVYRPWHAVTYIMVLNRYECNELRVRRSHKAAKVKKPCVHSEFTTKKSIMLGVLTTWQATNAPVSEPFAIGPVQFNWPRGVAENWFTEPGFWEQFVSLSRKNTKNTKFH